MIHLSCLLLTQSNHFADRNIPEKVLNRLIAWADSLSARGLSKEASHLITSCHKESMQTHYQSGWSFWLEYKRWQGILDKDVNIVNICNFLAHHFSIKKALNTIKNYLYAIRDPVDALYKLDIYNSKEIPKLFRGAFQQTSP